MNKYIYIFIICFLPCFSFSQGEADSLRLKINKHYSLDIIKGKPKINVRKKTFIDGFGDVLINGKKQFKYKRFDKNDRENNFIGSSFGIYKRKEKDIIFTSQNHTIRTPNEPVKYVIEFEFPSQKVGFLSKKVGTFSWFAAVKLMLYEKVIDLDGKIDVIQLRKFVEEYKDIESNSELYNKVKKNE